MFSRIVPPSVWGLSFCGGELRPLSRAARSLRWRSSCGRSCSCLSSSRSPLSLHWRPSLRMFLIQIEMHCFSSCVGGAPCWKRGGKCGQIDDIRWSAIRWGSVPRLHDSPTWGFAEAFSPLRAACRKTTRFSPSDHQLSCISPNLGAFSQQPPPP